MRTNLSYLLSLTPFFWSAHTYDAFSHVVRALGTLLMNEQTDAPCIESPHATGGVAPWPTGPRDQGRGVNLGLTPWELDEPW